jgi:hypothetical protein
MRDSFPLSSSSFGNPRVREGAEKRAACVNTVGMNGLWRFWNRILRRSTNQLKLLSFDELFSFMPAMAMMNTYVIFL